MAQRLSNHVVFRAYRELAIVARPQCGDRYRGHAKQEKEFAGGCHRHSGVEYGSGGLIGKSVFCVERVRKRQFAALDQGRSSHITPRFLDQTVRRSYAQQRVTVTTDRLVDFDRMLSLAFTDHVGERQWQRRRRSGN